MLAKSKARMIAKSLLLLLVACGACGAPQVGTWQGTLDIGGTQAVPLSLHLQEDGVTGRVNAKENGKAFEALQICSFKLGRLRQFELTYDANRPNCEQSADAADPRTYRGTVGEDTIFGEVFRGEQRIGFFRAFRESVAAAAAPAQASAPSPAPATKP